MNTNDYIIADSISENITYPTANAPLVVDNSRATKLSTTKKITTKIVSFFTATVKLFDRSIAVVESVIKVYTGFINDKWNSLLDAIKNIKITDIHLNIKVANFNLIINKPVYNVYM